MMIRALCAAALLAFTGGLLADDIEFFEKKYGIKLPGVKPKEEYKDPDSYYTEIARHLGIPQLAFKAAAGKFNWREDDKKITQSIIRRGPKADHWEIMIFRFAVNPESRKPDVGSMQAFLVIIDDDRKARSVERYDEALRRARRDPPADEDGEQKPDHEHRPAQGEKEHDRKENR